MPSERKITDADAEAIAEALKERIKSEFYTDLGKGVWGFAWRAILVVLIAIAAWGTTQSGLHK
jgi:hypothetical protein